MKKIALVFIILFVSCTNNEPIQFSELALEEVVFDLNKNQFELKEVLQYFAGKKILIDIWASWCGDCIKGLPAVSALQKEFPEVVFLFLSVDTGKEAWKNGIQRFQIKGKHFNLPKGMKVGAFVDFIDLSWIPRYMVINELGMITLFNATKASDSRLQKALKKAI